MVMIMYSATMVLICANIFSFGMKLSTENSNSIMNIKPNPTELSKISSIQRTCEDCIESSKNKFVSGSSYHSNAKPQMGTWADQDLVDELISNLDDTAINEESPFMTHLKSSPYPTISHLFNTEDYDLRIIYVPADQEIPRTHGAGTILLFKPLSGDSTITLRKDERTLQTDFLSTINETVSKPIRRLGGPIRYISSSRTKGCCLLELALHPPKASHSHYYGGIGVKINPDRLLSNSTMKLDVPEAYREDLLCSDQLLKKLKEEDRMSKSLTDPSPKLNKYNITSALSFNIGGLQDEVNSLVRRILLTRRIPPDQLKKLGVSHVKGLLLYGKPGTGKTLMAREIARALKAREPKIVNGPEIMDKYVGEAERNIRLMFTEAEEEWKERGDQSELHVIVFDEIDSIAKSRGSLVGDGSGVRDSCVNQLLTKIDGMSEMSNVLVIGLTNRKDLIDSALLRSGRLEIQLEIKPPNLQGRQEILAILLRSMILSNTVSVEEALGWIRKVAIGTDGWTGAELAGLIRSATSFALERYFQKLEEEIFNSDNGMLKEGSSGLGVCRVEEKDLVQALEEVKTSTSFIGPVQSKRKRFLTFFSNVFKGLFNRRKSDDFVKLHDDDYMKKLIYQEYPQFEIPGDAKKTENRHFQFSDVDDKISFNKKPTIENLNDEKLKYYQQHQNQQRESFYSYDDPWDTANSV